MFLQHSNQIRSTRNNGLIRKAISCDDLDTQPMPPDLMPAFDVRQGCLVSCLPTGYVLVLLIHPHFSDISELPRSSGSLDSPVATLFASEPFYVYSLFFITSTILKGSCCGPHPPIVPTIHKMFAHTLIGQKCSHRQRGWRHTDCKCQLHFYLGDVSWLM